MKRLLILFLTGFVIYSAYAQKFAINTGYNYFLKHAGYVGGEYRIDSNEGTNKNGPLNIGLGTYLHGMDGKFTVTPEVHLNKTWKHFLVTELSASPKNIKPSIGLSFFNLTRLQFGYSFPITDTGFKGFYVGFHLLIGRAPFYDEIALFD